MLSRRSPCVIPSRSVASAGLVGGDRHVVGALHQRDLGRRLDHAAAGGDRIGADVVERRRFLLDAVEDEEAERALRRRRGRSRRRGPSGSARRAGRGSRLPATSARPAAELDQLARPRFLEAGADPGQLALRRDDRDERPLAQSPAHAGEVEHARAALERGSASMRFSAISRRALSIRARRSAIVIGTMPPVIGRSARMDAGTAAPCATASPSQRRGGAGSCGGRPFEECSSRRAHQVISSRWEYTGRRLVSVVSDTCPQYVSDTTLTRVRHHSDTTPRHLRDVSETSRRLHVAESSRI